MNHGGGSLAKGAQQIPGEPGRAQWRSIELGEPLERFRFKCLKSCYTVIIKRMLYQTLPALTRFYSSMSLTFSSIQRLSRYSYGIYVPCGWKDVALR